MAEILLVNPKRRPSRRKSNPSPAQKKARAKFAAMARARAKGAKVMSNPKKRRSNPKKRRTTHARRSNPAPAVHHNPRRRTRHARRRNPIGLNASKPMELLTPALVGALGATGINTALANFGSVLPVSMMTGSMVYVTQALAALALAAVSGKAGSKRAMLMQAAEGSLTVTIHSAIVNLSGGMGMSLSGGMGAYMKRPGMGMFMPGRNATPPSVHGAAAPRLNGMGAYLTNNKSRGAQMQGMRQREMAARPRKVGFGR